MVQFPGRSTLTSVGSDPGPQQGQGVVRVIPGPCPEHEMLLHRGYTAPSQRGNIVQNATVGRRAVHRTRAWRPRSRGHARLNSEGGCSLLLVRQGAAPATPCVCTDILRRLRGVGSTAGGQGPVGPMLSTTRTRPFRPPWLTDNTAWRGIFEGGIGSALCTGGAVPAPCMRWALDGGGHRPASLGRPGCTAACHAPEAPPLR